MAHLRTRGVRQSPPTARKVGDVGPKFAVITQTHCRVTRGARWGRHSAPSHASRSMASRIFLFLRSAVWQTSRLLPRVPSASHLGSWMTLWSFFS